MSEGPVRSERHDEVAVLHLDDGKANAISHEVLDALNAALDLAEKEAQAVALLGRPGRFSAGFDLGTMRSGPAAASELVGRGAELLLRLLEAPLPIVAGCTGHALAMGALLLLAADRRIGAAGDFKIGLNEVAIGMTLPLFGVEIARERLSKRHLVRAVVQAEIYAPEAAVDAGYLDTLTDADAVTAAALAEAKRLGELPRRAFAETKRRLSAPLVERVRAELAADLAGFGSAS